jgi:undecaprenyl-phosphate galactose phosphotransferase
VPVVVIFFMIFDNIYARHTQLWQQIKKIFKVASCSGLFILSLLYCFEPLHNIHGIFTLIISIFIFFFLLLGRYFTKKILVVANLWQIPIILIGTGKTAEILMNSFQQDNGMSYNIVGIIKDNEEEVGKVFQGIPIIGSLTNAEETIKKTRIKNVLLAISGLNGDYLVDLVCRLQPCVRNIIFVPDILGIPVGNIEMNTLFDEKLVLLKVKNNLSLLHNRIFKQIIDFFAGIIICFLLLPIMAIIALLIKVDSKGSIFYIAKRLGKDNKEFFCYKFCTMYENNAEVLTEYLKNNCEAEQEWHEYAKLRGYDPRVTRIGKWLRKFSLDELPQIFNVLKSEMSLVGPRPYLPTETNKIDFYQKTILLVKPGITGLWQVSGRNEINFEGRLKMDCWYIRNWSPWLDIIILLKTVKVVLTGKGSY